MRLGEQGHVHAVLGTMSAPAVPHRESKQTARQLKKADKAGACRRPEGGSSLARFREPARANKEKNSCRPSHFTQGDHFAR